MIMEGRAREKLGCLGAILTFLVRLAPCLSDFASCLFFFFLVASKARQALTWIHRGDRGMGPSQLNPVRQIQT